MLRYAMLAFTMLPTCLVAQKASEEELIKGCVLGAEMTQSLVTAFTQVELNGRTLDPEQIGQFIAHMSLGMELERKFLLPVGGEKISAEDFYQVFAELNEERGEHSERIKALAEAISNKPLKVFEVKADMVVHCINARKK